MQRLIVVGGGVIGLSVGWQLARNGFPVTILERKEAGKEASWKAAGMLAPFSEAGFEDAEKLKLGCEALSLYPRFLAELEEDTGEKIELEGKGTFFVAADKSDWQWLEWIYAFKEKQGLPLSWLSETEVREKEPLLSPRILGGIHLPTERQVNHRALLQALIQACGKNLRLHAEAVEISEQGVRLKTGEFIEGSPILSAGAWSVGRKIRPVKGQILSVRGVKLEHMVRSPRVYLVSKSDGTLRIGATSEEKGFDASVTAGAVLGLLQNAWEILPGLEECPMESLEAGFRPTTPQDLPLIGRGIAAGHGRGGILLAPLTAYKMVEIYDRIERKETPFISEHDACGNFA